MVVHVDDMFQYPMGQFRRGGRLYKMSHMIGDNEEELHAMAQAVGVQRKWFQQKYPDGHPDNHYDVTMRARADAIKLGAVPITLRELAMLVRERRMAWLAKSVCRPSPKRRGSYYYLR